MSLPAPFVAVAATPLNVRPVPKVSKPLPPHRFFFTTIPAPGAGKFRVPSTQLFPEEKENLQPIQAKANKKYYKKKGKPRKIFKYEQKKPTSYNVGPIDLDGYGSLQVTFTINKK